MGLIFPLLHLLRMAIFGTLWNASRITETKHFEERRAMITWLSGKAVVQNTTLGSLRLTAEIALILSLRIGLVGLVLDWIFNNLLP